MLTAVSAPPRAEQEVTALPRTRQVAAAEIPQIAAARPSAATPVAFTRDAPSGDSGLSVQFAATASEDSAHAFWQALARRFPEVLGQREPTVIRFEHGGSVFWRVRTEGFGTLAEAQTLCARMRADGQACFVPRS
jgi:cell division septation protein DedD